MGSSPAAGATATDAAMPLSPPTDDGDDEDEGEGRCDERGGGGTTRDESGRWTTQGERVESDEGATRWRRTATEVRGEEAAVSLKIRQSRASFEQVFWRAAKNTRVILDHKPL
jgi:hypothetical protein